MATLADEPAPDFTEKASGAGKVVIASVTGLEMTAANACIEAGVRIKFPRGDYSVALAICTIKAFSEQSITNGNASASNPA